MGQQGKVLATNPSDPRLILGTHVVEGKKPTPASTYTHIHHASTYTHIHHAYTHTHTVKLKHLRTIGRIAFVLC